MENTNQAESICTTSYDQLNVVASRFTSEEEMKKYYLQMSDTINTNTLSLDVQTLHNSKVCTINLNNSSLPCST